VWRDRDLYVSAIRGMFPNNERIDCSSFVATNNTEVASDPSKSPMVADAREKASALLG
jgi:hypothetical protein